ncbi:hypothetical protein K402DRAFT_39832 [Aulographum hederae CBS 113979]|uniref:Uncharacterized protein n=1 Tax=Aulographum hederae CBS 113979 TaxID=1176131 RepID=A0A6G1H4R0_9PEZI|nr:hypothetical protein K402DRAFT_39832 [Aulographum hederae CBS 113979]
MTTVESQWQSYSGAENYGWTGGDFGAKVFTPEMEKVFDGLGIQHDFPPMKQVQWRQAKEGTDPNGNVYSVSVPLEDNKPAISTTSTNILIIPHRLPSQASYVAVYSPSNPGMIYNINRKSPAAKRQDVIDGNAEFGFDDPIPILPALQRWSDIGFIEWQNLAGSDVKNLRYVFNRWAVNEDTMAVAQALLDAHAGGTDGLKFAGDMPWIDADSDAGLQWIRTPNVSGTAWFLINHKEKMGLRRIARVKLFVDDEVAVGKLVNEGMMKILVELEEVPVDGQRSK